MAGKISWMLGRLLQAFQQNNSHTSCFLSLSSKHSKSISEVSRVGECIHILELPLEKNVFNVVFISCITKKANLPCDESSEEGKACKLNREFINL